MEIKGGSPREYYDGGVYGMQEVVSASDDADECMSIKTNYLGVVW